jgi:hypothetical protein
MSEVPDWFGSSLITALLDPTPGMTSSTLEIPGAAEAIGEFKWHDPELKNAVVAAILRGIDETPPENIYRTKGALQALAQIDLSSSKQREVVVAAVLTVIDRAIDNRAHYTGGPISEVLHWAVKVLVVPYER